MKDDGVIDWFEFIVLTFTVYILVSLSLQTLYPNLNPEIARILAFYDLISCAIFLIDWFGRLSQATNKWKFSLYNSLDLIASLPLIFFFEYLGYLKILRLIQLTRLIKIIGGINRIRYYSKRNKLDYLKLLISFVFLTIIIVGPIMVLIVERNTGNIKTAEQALWWTYCTFTTIGYGDFFPSSTYGRLIAIIISLGGISMFGLISTLIANNIILHGKTKDTGKTE